MRSRTAWREGDGYYLSSADSSLTSAQRFTTRRTSVNEVLLLTVVHLGAHFKSTRSPRSREGYKRQTSLVCKRQTSRMLRQLCAATGNICNDQVAVACSQLIHGLTHENFSASELARMRHELKRSQSTACNDDRCSKMTSADCVCCRKGRGLKSRASNSQQ